MERRHRPGDGSPNDEFMQIVGEIQRRFQQFSLPGVGPWAVALVFLLIWLGSGFYVVGPGERGVVLLFRKATEQTEPGLRYHLPWPIQSHEVVDIAQVRRVEVGFRTADTGMERGSGGNTRTVPQEALMLTGDENIVELQFFVQYRIVDPVKFLFGASEPEGILHTSAEVALRSAVGRNTIDYTMTDGRVEVQEQAKTALQELLEAYQTGLLVTEARLLVVDPPSEVRDAFHDVVRALEDRDRLVKEADGYREDVVPKARGEAAQMIQQAEGYKAQRVIRAQGDAERFLKILAEYDKARAITRDRLYLESIERIMPNMEKFILDSSGKSGVLPLLPLRGAMPSAIAQELGQTPTSTTEERR